MYLKVRLFILYIKFFLVKKQKTQDIKNKTVLKLDEKIRSEIVNKYLFMFDEKSLNFISIEK